MIDSYVTGAGGFIGQHLLKRLEGKTVAIPHVRIPTYQYQRFRRMFYLAAYGNMAHHTNELLMLRANVTDLAQALQEMPTNNIECFLYVSSSSVTLPVQTPYSRTKRAAEEFLQAMPIPVAIVRPFSVTGRGEMRQHLIPQLINSCMTGHTIDFVPSAIHDYVDVGDVVEGMVRLADKRKTGVFEFGSGKATTNWEVMALVEAATGKKANVRVVKSMRTYDSDGWCCHRPANEFVVTKSLADSISDMVEAYESNN